MAAPGGATHFEMESLRRDVEEIKRVQKENHADVQSQLADVRDILRDLAENHFGRPPIRPRTQSRPSSPRAASPAAATVPAARAGPATFGPLAGSQKASVNPRPVQEPSTQPTSPVASKSTKVTFSQELDAYDGPTRKKSAAGNDAATAAPPKQQRWGSEGGSDMTKRYYSSTDEDEASDSDDDAFDPTASQTSYKKSKSGKAQVQFHDSWERSKIPNRRFVALGFDIFATSVHEDYDASATGKFGRSVTGPRQAQLVLKDFRRCCGISAWRNFKMDKLVMSPSSKFSLFWTLLEALLLISDFVMIPMLMFDDEDGEGVVVPPGSPWSNISLWQRRISIVFWSIDFPLSFFKGFIDKNGERVDRFRKVAKKYVVGGAPLDVPLLIIEYVTFFLDEAFSEGRTLRALRYARTLKAGKLRRLSGRLLARVKRPESLAAVKMVGQVFAVILMCHIFACLWYGVGTHLQVEGSTWTIVFAEPGLYDMPAGSIHAFRYFTSLRWALAQLGFGDSQVYPRNWAESLFATVFSVVCVIVMTQFLGLIITSMIRLQDGKRDDLIQRGQMREYLQQHDITFDLQDRIWSVLKGIEADGSHRKTEEQVELVAKLPNSLEIELRAEVFVKPLTCHPFFGIYGVSGADPHAMYNIVRKKAVELKPVEPKEELFSEHEIGTSMWFVVQGSLSYRFKHEPREVCEKQWIAEATLWLTWRYVGTATAITACDIVELGGDVFREIMQADLPQAKKYAKAFYSCASKMGRTFNECEPSKVTVYMMAQDAFSPAKAFVLSDCHPIARRRLDEWRIAQQTASEDWQNTWSSPWNDTHAHSASAMLATLVTEMKRDIIMVYQTLFSQNLADTDRYAWPSDVERDLYDKRILFLKRLIVMMGMCHVGCSDEDNSTQLQPWAFPLASIICHGGRSMVRLHGVHPREVLNFLTLGDKDGNNWGNGPPGPLYTRLAASHSVKVDASGMLQEVKLKGVAGATGRGHNLGMDLPVGGLGNKAPTHKAGSMYVGPAGVPYKLQGTSCVPVHQYQHGHMYVRWDDFGSKTLKSLAVDHSASAQVAAASWPKTPEAVDRSTSSLSAWGETAAGQEGGEVHTLRTAYIGEVAMAASKGSAHDVGEDDEPEGSRVEFDANRLACIESSADLENLLPRSSVFDSSAVKCEHLFKYVVDRNELALTRDEQGLVDGCYGVMAHLSIELEGATSEDLVLCHLGAAMPNSSGMVLVKKNKDAGKMSKMRTDASQPTGQSRSLQSRNVSSASLSASSGPVGGSTLEDIIQDDRVISVLCTFDGLWLPTLMHYVQKSFQLSDAAVEKIYQGLSEEVWIGESEPSPTINHHHMHACSSTLDLKYHAVYLKSRIHFKDVGVFEKFVSLGSSRISDDMVFMSGLGDRDADEQLDPKGMHMIGIKREWAWVPKSEAEDRRCSDMNPPEGAIKMRLESRDVTLGSLLLGIENSAPLKEDLFGGTHNASAKSKDASAFGKRKWRDYRKNGRVAGSLPSPAVLRVPAEFGGVQMFMDRTRFEQYMKVCNELSFSRPSAPCSVSQDPKEEQEFFQSLLCADARHAESVITQYAGDIGLPGSDVGRPSAQDTGAKEL